ncbi:MAG: hypothetical protein PVH19_02005 [Planctomycetia bacterium]|jgi:hypothetical protein
MKGSRFFYLTVAFLFGFFAPFVVFFLFEASPPTFFEGWYKKHAILIYIMTAMAPFGAYAMLHLVVAISKIPLWAWRVFAEFYIVAALGMMASHLCWYSRPDPFVTSFLNLFIGLGFWLACRSIERRRKEKEA